MKRNTLLNLLMMAAAVTACAPFPDEPPQSEATAPVPEAEASATPIVWFPPTATFTVVPVPTIEATAEHKPGIGTVLVTDPMTSATHWNASSSGDAAAIVSAQGLTLSAQPGSLPVVSLHRSAILDDMYLEITARPSLCRGRDAYGVAFRAPNEVASYRFVAACDGTAAVERVSLGTPRVLQPPTPSSDVPVGAPGEVRMGIWAHASEFRLFLNGQFQFVVNDKNYLAGGIGVFVAANGDSPVVVTFSDLQVFELQSPPTFGTAAP